MNDNFVKLNEKYLGIGNPNSWLWFIGAFEEAGEWVSQSEIDNHLNPIQEDFVPLLQFDILKSRNEFYARRKKSKNFTMLN